MTKKSDAVKIKMGRDPSIWLAVGLGAGLSPYAPGTAGSVFALALYYLFLIHLPVLYYAGVVIVTFFLGVWLCERATRQFKVDDHPAIVIDEIVGLWAALFLVPPTLSWGVLVFLWFRWFDITKPLGIAWIDKRIKGGMGIMLDDLLAALYTWLVVQACLLALHYYLPEGI